MIGNDALLLERNNICCMKCHEYNKTLITCTHMFAFE